MTFHQVSRRTLLVAAGAMLTLSACRQSSGNSEGATVPITSIDDLARSSDAIFMGTFRSFTATSYTPPYSEETALVVGTMDVTRSSPSGADRAILVWGKDGANALGPLGTDKTYLFFGSRVTADEREVLRDQGDIYLPTAGKKGVFIVDGDHATQLAGGFDEPQGTDSVSPSRRATTQSLDTLFGGTLRKRCTGETGDPSC